MTILTILGVCKFAAMCSLLKISVFLCLWSQHTRADRPNKLHMHWKSTGRPEIWPDLLKEIMGWNERPDSTDTSCFHDPPNMVVRNTSTSPLGQWKCRQNYSNVTLSAMSLVLGKVRIDLSITVLTQWNIWAILVRRWLVFDVSVYISRVMFKHTHTWIDPENLFRGRHSMKDQYDQFRGTYSLRTNIS